MNVLAAREGAISDKQSQAVRALWEVFNRPDNPFNAALEILRMNGCSIERIEISKRDTNEISPWVGVRILPRDRDPQKACSLFFDQLAPSLRVQYSTEREDTVQTIPATWRYNERRMPARTVYHTSAMDALTVLADWAKRQGIMLYPRLTGDIPNYETVLG